MKVALGAVTLVVFLLGLALGLTVLALLSEDVVR